MLSIVQDTVGNLWLLMRRSVFSHITSKDVRQVQWSELGHNDHASVWLLIDSGGAWIGFLRRRLLFYDGRIRHVLHSH